MADMRRIFLKTQNKIDGRYFAELLKIVLSRLENEKGHNSAAEMRLSIYGMERHEWADLSKWLLTDWDFKDFPGNMMSTDNRWVIQIPRLWRIYSAKHEKRQPTFQEMLENIFIPMFEATLYPDKNPEIAETLKHIVAIDSVDDEGAGEVSLVRENHRSYCALLWRITHPHPPGISYPIGALHLRQTKRMDISEEPFLRVASVLFVVQSMRFEPTSQSEGIQYHHIQTACWGNRRPNAPGCYIHAMRVDQSWH